MPKKTTKPRARDYQNLGVEKEGLTLKKLNEAFRATSKIYTKMILETEDPGPHEELFEEYQESYDRIKAFLKEKSKGTVEGVSGTPRKRSPLKVKKRKEPDQPSASDFSRIGVSEDVTSKKELTKALQTKLTSYIFQMEGKKGELSDFANKVLMLDESYERIRASIAQLSVKDDEGEGIFKPTREEGMPPGSEEDTQRKEPPVVDKPTAGREDRKGKRKVKQPVSGIRGFFTGYAINFDELTRGNNFKLGFHEEEKGVRFREAVPHGLRSGLLTGFELFLRVFIERGEERDRFVDCQISISRGDQGMEIGLPDGRCWVLKEVELYRNDTVAALWFETKKKKGLKTRFMEVLS